MTTLCLIIHWLLVSSTWQRLPTWVQMK
jgi:hypothetical protein